MTHRLKSIAFLILPILLSACATIASDPPGIAAPRVKLFPYSAAFQSKLADEIQTLSPPCDRVNPVLPCSALNRITGDYLYDRDQMRASGIQPTP